MTGTNNWWCFKLYCDITESNSLVQDSVHFCEELRESGLVESYFYIRYSDPNYHIRLRFHCSQNYDSYTFIFSIMDWIALQHKRRHLSTYTICSYDRDLERYGGPNAYSHAEKVFYFNSLLVGRYLSQSKDFSPPQQMAFAISVIYSICLACDLSISEQDRLLSSRINPSEHREIYKADRTLFVQQVENQSETALSERFGDLISCTFELHRQAVSDYWAIITQMDGEHNLTNSKTDILFSLIHMFCNRLDGNQSFERMSLCLLRHSIHDVQSKAVYQSNHGSKIRHE